MIHPQFEFASFSIQLAVHHQAAFTVTQCLHIPPLKVGQFRSLPRLTPSLQQLQALRMYRQPHVALRFFLAAFTVLIVITVNAINIIIVIFAVIVIARFIAA